MIFVSSTDGTQKATEHMVVFRYEERRVLLPLPETYDDAVRVAREEFQLSGNATISFATRELPGCDGEAVEIHPRTWAAITPILAQITVKVEHGAPIGSNVVQRLTSEAPTLPDDSQREATPTARGKSKESTPGRDDQPAAVSRIRKRPSMAGPAANGAPRKSIVRLSISGVKEENVPRPSAAKPFINPFAGAASSYPRAELTGSRVAATPPPPAQQLNTHEEDGEEEEEEILKSPRKGKSARKRVMSDDELEYEEIEAPQSSEEGRGASARASSSNGGRASALVTPKQERAAKKARTPPRELAHSPTSTAVARPAERIVNSSETCLITVDYDDGHEVCSSTFKTKGRHSVHKVLMTVCKTFGIEDLYARVNLVRIITDSTDDPSYEGNDVIEQRFTCPRASTMTQVGAHDGARFAVEVFEDESDTA